MVHRGSRGGFTRRAAPWRCAPVLPSLPEAARRVRRSRRRPAPDSFGNLDARALRGTVALSDNKGDLDASGLAGDLRLNVTDSFGKHHPGTAAGRHRLPDPGAQLVRHQRHLRAAVTVRPDMITVSNDSGEITIANK